MLFNDEVECNTKLFALVSESEIDASLNTPVHSNEEFSMINLGTWQLKELLLKQRVMTAAAISTWLEVQAHLRYQIGDRQNCTIMKDLADSVTYLYNVNRIERD